MAKPTCVVVGVGPGNGAAFAPLEFTKFNSDNFEWYATPPGGQHIEFAEHVQPGSGWIHHAVVKDGEVFTPVPNGTFLNGITRQRHIKLLTEAGRAVHETTLTFDDFRNADEIFMSGNLAKVTPVTQFDDRHYQSGPVTRQAKELYWDWALSA